MTKITEQLEAFTPEEIIALHSQVEKIISFSKEVYEEHQQKIALMTSLSKTFENFGDISKISMIDKDVIISSDELENDALELKEAYDETTALWQPILNKLTYLKEIVA
jgi:hypothetical protein